MVPELFNTFTSNVCYDGTDSTHSKFEDNTKAERVVGFLVTNKLKNLVLKSRSMASRLREVIFTLCSPLVKGIWNAEVQFWVLQQRRKHAGEKPTKMMMKGLECLKHKKLLRELQLFSFRRKGTESSYQCVYMMGKSKEDVARLFPVVPGEMTRSNRQNTGISI